MHIRYFTHTKEIKCYVKGVPDFGKCHKMWVCLELSKMCS